MKVRDLFESDDDHYQALKQTGFWGRQGAGCLILSRDSGRFLIPYRAKLWNENWGRYEPEQPHTYGTWGGAVDHGDTPEETVRKEVYEECGYSGHMDLIPLYVFTAPGGTFRYSNFLALVDREFYPVLDPYRHWETESCDWYEFGDWPQPLHFGLEALLNDPASIKRIKAEVDAIKSSLD